MKRKINPPLPPGAAQGESQSRKKFYIDKVARFCDKCGRPYEIDDVTVLQQNQFSAIIHFECKNCKARHLATFIQQMGLTSRMPINTDLNLEELPRFVKLGAVSSNEILDVHEMLSSDDDAWLEF